MQNGNHRLRSPLVTCTTCLRLLLILLCVACVDRPPARSAEPDLRDDALRVMKSAAAFYRQKVASHGGYVYLYSEDLKQRWGEGKADAETIIVQPPGTPAVGMAYLKAHAATGDKFYLEAARETAEALVYGQLKSGGWTQTIHFGPAEQKGERRGKYRNGKGGDWNRSSLDDGQTQAALKMLMLADQALEFKHAAIHEAAQYGLNALLQAQFANGAFPQVWAGPATSQPVVKAKFPDYDWKTEGRLKNYWDYYTLNDGLAGSVADTLITARQVYRDDKSQAAITRLGDFLILAQMPEPQPGWCQQYNYDMVPIWARKFEPPAVTAWESQDVMETLIRIARHTGDKKYLEPIPRALAYFKQRLLPDGRVARYYEFGTHKPLYMDAKYQLSYDDSAAPSHYGWKQKARFDKLEESLQQAHTGTAAARPNRSIKSLTEDVRKIISDLDAQGRWVKTYAGEPLVGQPKLSPSFRYLSSDVFSRNIEVLSEYVEVTNAKP